MLLRAALLCASIGSGGASLFWRVNAVLLSLLTFKGELLQRSPFSRDERIIFSERCCTTHLRGTRVAADWRSFGKIALSAGQSLSVSWKPRVIRIKICNYRRTIGATSILITEHRGARVAENYFRHSRPKLSIACQSVITQARLNGPYCAARKEVTLTVTTDRERVHVCA